MSDAELAATGVVSRIDKCTWIRSREAAYAATEHEHSSYIVITAVFWNEERSSGSKRWTQQPNIALTPYCEYYE